MYKKIKCKGWPCFYVDYGEKNKKVIVFLHGYSDSAKTFEPLESYLGDKYRVIIPDMPMVRKEGVSYDLESLCHFVDVLTTKMGFSRFILCGFSFGGLVAAHFAYLYPKKVKKLYLLNCVPQFLAPEMVERLLLRIEPREVPRFVYSLMGLLRASKLGRFFVPKTDRLEKSIRNTTRRSFAVFATMYEVIRHNIIGGSWSERVRKFLKMPMPKAVVLFKDDEVISYEKYATKLRRSGVDVVSFDRGGHADGTEYWENIKTLF
jgi:pimeloyl-ACP methyl ester carboxylesterase